MHHEPVFAGFQQPDEHRSEKHHQRLSGGTQRLQPRKEFQSHRAHAFPKAAGHKAHTPRQHAFGLLREHGRQQKGRQRPQERHRPAHGKVLNAAHEARAGGQARHFGQVEEHESQHHHAIVNPFNQNSAQGSRHGHAFMALEQHRPQQLPGTRRVNVVAHVANRHQPEHGANGHRL